MSAVILRLGDTGPGVTEVRERLAHVGMPASAAGRGDLFDAGLEAAVRVFQQSRGLTVDGIAGPQTLRRLAKQVRPHAFFIIGKTGPDRVCRLRAPVMRHQENEAGKK